MGGRTGRLGSEAPGGAEKGSGMILVNFSGRTVEAAVLPSLAALTGLPVEEVREVTVSAALPAAGFQGGIAQLVEAIGCTQAQLQTEPVVVIPPEASDIACGLLAELHGRIGHFPGLLRPTSDAFEVVNLQQLRSQAMGRRYPVG